MIGTNIWKPCRLNFKPKPTSTQDNVGIWKQSLLKPYIYLRPWRYFIKSKYQVCPHPKGLNKVALGC